MSIILRSYREVWRDALRAKAGPDQVTRLPLRRIGARDGVYVITGDRHEEAARMPDYAVISVGKDNGYGHPNQQTLDMLNSEALKSKVYRTDQDGDIVVRSNGKEISVEAAKELSQEV